MDSEETGRGVIEGNNLKFMEILAENYEYITRDDQSSSQNSSRVFLK